MLSRDVIQIPQHPTGDVIRSAVIVMVIVMVIFGVLSLHRENGLSYLSLRTCIGLWTAFLCLLLVATDASSLVCYITRFTEEAFASLICLIFIYEALEKLIHLGEHYPVNMNNNLQKLTQYSYVSHTHTRMCSPYPHVVLQRDKIIS